MSFSVGTRTVNTSKVSAGTSSGKTLTWALATLVTTSSRIVLRNTILNQADRIRQTSLFSIYAWPLRCALFPAPRWPLFGFLPPRLPGGLRTSRHRCCRCVKAAPGGMLEEYRYRPTNSTDVYCARFYAAVCYSTDNLRRAPENGETGGARPAAESAMGHSERTKRTLSTVVLKARRTDRTTQPRVMEWIIRSATRNVMRT